MADGTLKVGTITNSAGSGNIAIGSGVTLLSSTPAFGASRSGTQSISASTWTKIEFNNEIFDTNNAYDNSTNYRFTVPSGQAGKYYITLDYIVQSSSNDQTYNILGIRKNGILFKRSDMNSNSTANAQFRRFPASSCIIADLNVGDYIEAFAYVSATSPFIDTDDVEARSFFGAYRIGA
jgi:hypothetical protein